MKTNRYYLISAGLFVVPANKLEKLLQIYLVSIRRMLTKDDARLRSSLNQLLANLNKQNPRSTPLRLNPHTIKPKNGNLVLYVERAKKNSPPVQIAVITLTIDR